MADTAKADISHVEHLEDGGVMPTKRNVMGTVKLTEGRIIYIPTPTADPRGEPFTYLSRGPRVLILVDPLNMGLWQKWIVLVVISICE